MKKALSVFAALAALSAMAERNVTSLSGAGWTCDGEPVTIPHTWNAVDGADGSPTGEEAWPYGGSIKAESYAHKKVVYLRALPDPTPGRRQFVRFGAISQRASVKINGKAAGRHIGAFTAFTVEATEFLKPQGNVMEVEADNIWDENIPPLSADYTLMGGIYRDVEWLETPLTCIDPVTDGADGVVLDVNTNGIVKATVRVLGPDKSVRTVVQEKRFDKVELWSPENPKLYTFKVEIPEGDSLEVPFGFRTVEFREDGFYLNGVKRKLKGVNRHQDAGECGWAATAAEDERDFAIIKEIGADAVRLAHYPQSRRVMDICDREGFLVWCEAPAINWFSTSVDFKENLFTAAREMIAQNRNHPSIFAWSVFNEIYCMCPRERAAVGWMEAFVKELKETMNGLDPSRKVVAASCTIDKTLLNSIPDELAVNVYPRWYSDLTMGEYMDRWFRKNDRKMLGISEYGVGGSPFDHIDPVPDGRPDPAKCVHYEERQTLLMVDNCRAIAADERIWGSFIWAMFDFAADARREGEHHGLNDKGMVTRDRAIKKDAFYLFKANWSKEPTLHICSKRMTETDKKAINVVGFSNVGKAELWVNGVKRGELIPDEVKRVRDEVELAPGENVIELRAGGLVDARKITCK